MNSLSESRNFDQSKQSAAEQNLALNTGRWTGEEHNRFLQGLQQHGKVWKSIATVVKTRSIVQVRTHAQKYFMKMNRGDSPTPTSKPPSLAGSPPPAKNDMSMNEPSNLEPIRMSKSVSSFKGSQWKSASVPSSMPKSKSYGSMSSISGDMSGFGKSSYHYPRDGLGHMPPSLERPTGTTSKPRARKFEEVGGDLFHKLAVKTAAIKTEKATKKTIKTEKATKKKPSQKSTKTTKKTKAHGNSKSQQVQRPFDTSGYPQPLPYYGPSTAPGMSYSYSYPSLHDRHGSLPSEPCRKPYMSPKKAEARNKRARLSKTAAGKARPSASYNSTIMDAPLSMHNGMGESPTRISHPLSCPDFSYYQDATSNYSYQKCGEIDEISEQMAEAARIPCCDSETEDSLDLENMLLKESLLSSGKKEWPLEDHKVVMQDEFNLLKPEDTKILDCGDLKLKVPGNEGFSLPQKYSPTSVMEPCPTWAALSYPDFVKEEKDLNLVPEEDTFMPMTSSNDENNLFWFGDDSFEDLLETM